MTVNPQEKAILRSLALRVADILDTDTVAERIRLWKKHNALEQERPMVMVSPEGSWNEIAKGNPDVLEPICTEPMLRHIEWQLRSQIYAFEHFQADNVPDCIIGVPKAIISSGWGVEAKWHYSDKQGGARAFDPVIKDEKDLEKLRWPEVSLDQDLSNKRLAAIQEIFDGTLPVKSFGISHVSAHAAAHWTAWRGLEEVMMDMVVDPAFTHRALSFITEGIIRYYEQCETLGLLEYNYNNTYHSSGGNGWLDAMPGPTPPSSTSPVRRANLWASSEAQEYTGISPAMHEEFSLQYEKKFLAPFALAGYGCCEDLSDKCDLLLKIPNMRRISISPFTSVAKTAPVVGRRAIFSWKPHPAELAGNFSPERIRSHAADALAHIRANNCNAEIVLKDTHTCERDPSRFDKWCSIIQEVLASK